MANVKITELTALTDPASTDVLPIVDVVADVTKKISIADLLRNAGSGTAAAPGIAFDGDSNTGIYRPGANQVAVSTDGTARLTVSTSAVTSALPIDVLLGSASTPSFTFTGDLNTGIYSPGADQVAISTNGTGRLFIDSSGNVGIGTTSPQDTFHLNTTSGSTTARISSSTNTSGLQLTARGDGTGCQLAAFGTSSDLRFFTTNSGGSTNEAVRIDSSQRLLVGTSSGVASNTAEFQGNSFSSSGPANVYIKLGATNPSSGSAIGNITFSDSTGSVAGLITCASDGTWGANDYPGRLVFSTNPGSPTTSPVERMRIENTGQTRVFGTDNVILSRSAQAAGTTNSVFIGYHSATNIGSGGTASCIIYTNGNVVNTNNSYGAISDVKLKENIVDASSQWDDIKDLRVRNYNFIEGQTHTQIGVVAQEVEAVSPGLVTESPDRDEEGNDLGTTTKSVNYSVLYMKAVKALQEAMERIETLETSNADLLARVSALEAS